MKSASWLLGIILLASQVGVGQTTAPPSCSVESASKPMTLTPSKRPSAEQVRETAAAAAADPTVLVSAEPVPNFGTERYRLADYAECTGTVGCYWADLDAQTKRAEAVLERAIATKKRGEKLAIVLDIDETSMTNFCELRREDYGFLLTAFNQWAISSQAAMPIPGTVHLANRAQAAGVEVFFITGRWEEQREPTAKNLESAGFKGWKGLALRVGPQKQMTTVDYKSQERQKILNAGYRIVLNMGDQWSDLNGQARGETSVKLPNPFYYLP